MLLPPQTFAQMYHAAYKIVGEDPELTLLMGAAAYKANMDWRFVLMPLDYAAKNFPPQKRNAIFYKSQVFYADALANTGNVMAARQVSGSAPDATRARTRSEEQDPP